MNKIKTGDYVHIETLRNIWDFFRNNADGGVGNIKIELIQNKDGFCY